MIEVKNLVKNYGRFPAVKGVSFSIGKGDIVGLRGPNGAGQTTIMKVLTCYHYPDGGSATLNGYDAIREPLQVKHQIGYLPEMAPVYTDLNVYEYLNFIAEARGIDGAEKGARIEKTAAECGLTSVLYKEIGNLSKGYRQRVGLAQAILHEPEILILDEPTTGLDPNQIIEIRNLIKKIGKEKTVLLSTHILQEVEAVCDRDAAINALEVSTDRCATLLIAKHQPTATDLRFVFGIAKMATDFERMGDQARNIARASRAEVPEDLIDKLSQTGIVESTVKTVNLAMLALKNLSETAAVNTLRSDNDVDKAFNEGVKVVTLYLKEHPENVEHVLGALDLLKAYERLGDHATNIAEHVIFILDGEDIRHLRLDALPENLTKLS